MKIKSKFKLGESVSFTGGAIWGGISKRWLITGVCYREDIDGGKIILYDLRSEESTQIRVPEIMLKKSKTKGDNNADNN